MMEKALFELLKKAPGIRSKIGTRIYPLEIPQGTKYPAIVYQRISGARDYDMQGATGLVESRFFIWFYGIETRLTSAYGNAKELKDLIVGLFTQRPGYYDLIGDTEIQGVFINDEDDKRLEAANGIGIVRVQLDCTFWHRDLRGA
jgi:hypothetical protein